MIIGTCPCNLLLKTSIHINKKIPETIPQKIQESGLFITAEEINDTPNTLHLDFSMEEQETTTDECKLLDVACNSCTKLWVGNIIINADHSINCLYPKYHSLANLNLTAK